MKRLSYISIIFIAFFSITHTIDLSKKRPLSNDEGYITEKISSSKSILDLMTKYINEREPNQPTYNAILYMLKDILNIKGKSFRFVSMIILTCLILYFIFLSRDILDEKSWGPSVLLLLISSPVLWYGQFIRVYILQLFLSMILFHCSYKIYSEQTYSKIMSRIVIFLLANTHLSGLFLSIISSVITYYKTENKKELFIEFILILPSVIYFMILLHSFDSTVAKISWIEQINFFSVIEIASYPIVSQREAIFGEKLSFVKYFAIPLYSISIIYVVFKYKKYQNFLLSFMLPPFLLFFIFAIINFTVIPILLPRYFIAYIIPIYLSVGFFFKDVVLRKSL